MDFEIIDAHVHLAQTVEEEGDYWIIPGRRARDRSNTPDRVVSYMDRNGISNMVFLVLIPRQYRAPLADKVKLPGLPEGQKQKERKRISQQIAPLIRKYNEWGCEVGRRFPQLLPFVGLSNDLGGAEAMVEELVLRVGQGAKGVKLHPGMFSFFPDDKEMWPVYEKCQELGLPVLADSGPFPLSHVLAVYPLWYQMPPAHVDYGQPKNFARVLEAFPRLTYILAHLGSAWWDERVELAQKYPNVVFDTAQGFSAPDRIPVCPHRSLAEEDTVRIMRKIGVERIMFGTDSPAIAPQPQLEQILRLPLSDEEKKLILSENAKRILHI
ncbi:MAG: amidohydrolase family protein [Dehalococcoidales bacterium]